MIKEQLEQINNEFKFLFEGEEVVVTGVIKHPQSEEHSEVRLCKTDNYHIVGPFKKGFIAQYLEKTNQAHLLDIEIISAGKNIVNDLGLQKIGTGAHKGLYTLSNKHSTWGGSKPKSLLEIGRIAIQSLTHKEFGVWLNTLDMLKKQEDGE